MLSDVDGWTALFTFTGADKATSLYSASILLGEDRACRPTGALVTGIAGWFRHCV
jgi:hypothetical protein